MSKAIKIILAICIALIVILGAAVFLLFNTFKDMLNNNVAPMQTVTTIASQQANNSNNNLVTTQAINNNQAQQATNNQQMNQAPAQTAAVSQDKAIQAALAHAGLQAGNGTFTHAQLDQFDDNIRQLHYDVEIIANGFEYDYKIDANTGSVITSSKQIHD